MFARSDTASEAAAAASRELSSREAEEQRASAEHQQSDLAHAALVEELTRRRGAGTFRRMFMRGEGEIFRDLTRGEERARHAEDQLEHAQHRRFVSTDAMRRAMEGSGSAGTGGVRTGPH
jgi:hypothetical protein